jgi:hypothetical protein
MTKKVGADDRNAEIQKHVNKNQAMGKFVVLGTSRHCVSNIILRMFASSCAVK